MINSPSLKRSKKPCVLNRKGKEKMGGKRGKKSRALGGETERGSLEKENTKRTKGGVPGEGGGKIISWQEKGGKRGGHITRKKKKHKGGRKRRDATRGGMWMNTGLQQKTATKKKTKREDSVRTLPNCRNTITVRERKTGLVRHEELTAKVDSGEEKATIFSEERIGAPVGNLELKSLRKK